VTLRLNGATSGFTEIDAPAVAGSNTLVLPGGNGTADQALVTNGSGTLSFADRGRMVLETAKASTSGTSIDFTGIPSWVKRITVMFNGVSTNGTSDIVVRLGTSTGVVTTGYVSTSTGVNQASATGGGNSTTGFLIRFDSAAFILSGHMFVTNISSNNWISSHTLKRATDQICFGGGDVLLAATLDRVRITTVNGTDTFDAGSINLLLEG
jgi:hypothetical protein